MYYRSNLCYDIAVRNGNRVFVDLKKLNIPIVAINNIELIDIIKKIINELELDTDGCDRNHVPYYIETSVYDLLSKSYIGIQGISLNLLDKNILKWAEKTEFRFDCIYSEQDITDVILGEGLYTGPSCVPMTEENYSSDKEIQCLKKKIEKISIVYIQKPKPFQNVYKYCIAYKNGQITYIDEIKEIWNIINSPIP